MNLIKKIKDEWVWKLPKIKDGLNEDGINNEVCFEVSMIIPWVDNNEKKEKTRAHSLVPHIGPRKVSRMGLRWNDKIIYSQASCSHFTYTRTKQCRCLIQMEPN